MRDMWAFCIWAMGLPLRNNDFADFIIFMVAQSRKVPTLGCYVMSKGPPLRYIAKTGSHFWIISIHRKSILDRYRAFWGNRTSQGGGPFCISYGVQSTYNPLFRSLSIASTYHIIGYHMAIYDMLPVAVSHPTEGQRAFWNARSARSKLNSSAPRK